MLVVTGPTGNVGAEITDLLASDDPGFPFRVAAHNPDKLRDTYGPEIPTARFDYDDRSTWEAVLDGISILFLLFPLPQPKTVRTRMKPFIDAAIRAGCRHIVYVSVPGADSTSFGARFVPHHQVERHIETSGAGYTFLRPSYFMQNLVRRISTHGVDIATRGEIFIPAGKGRTSFVDSRDVAAVALDVFKNPERHRNQGYTLTGERRLDFYEVAEVFSEVMGRPIRYTKPSMPQFWYRMARRGVSWDTILFMTIVYTLTRTSRNETLTDELPKLLGRPPTSLRQFVEDYLPRWETRSWT